MSFKNHFKTFTAVSYLTPFLKWGGGGLYNEQPTFLQISVISNDNDFSNVYLILLLDNLCDSNGQFMRSRLAG